MYYHRVASNYSCSPSLSQVHRRDTTLSLTMSTTYSSTTTTHPPILRVYSRRPRITRDCGILQPLQKVLPSDLHTAKETSGNAANPTPAADSADERAVAGRWMVSIDSILEYLRQELQDVPEVELDVMIRFVIEESKTKAP